MRCCPDVRRGMAAVEKRRAVQDPCVVEKTKAPPPQRRERERNGADDVVVVAETGPTTSAYTTRNQPRPKRQVREQAMEECYNWLRLMSTGEW